MVREIPLTQGKVTLVDDEDYPRLSTYKWCALKGRHTFYAVRNSPGPDSHLIFMHHEILGRPEFGFQVDHINGDGLNNCKDNLRVATQSQNLRNMRSRTGSSQYKGVSWHSLSKKWRAYISIDGKLNHLGLFISEEEAARIYDSAALEHYCEFAALNFPRE